MYKHKSDIAQERWAKNKVIGQGGWNNFTHLTGDGEGTIFPVTADGNLRWYRYNGDGNWAEGSGSTIGAYETSLITYDHLLHCEYSGQNKKLF